MFIPWKQTPDPTSLISLSMTLSGFVGIRRSNLHYLRLFGKIRVSKFVEGCLGTHAKKGRGDFQTKVTGLEDKNRESAK